MSAEQMELFNHFKCLLIRESIPLYWELEGQFLKSHSHRYMMATIERHLGEKFLHEITKYDLENYLAARKMENANLKHSSLNREITRIKRMFNAFKGWKRTGKVNGYNFADLELPFENPASLVAKADESKYRRNVVLTEEQFFKWCNYARPEIRKIATIALLTLLRRRDIQVLEKNAANRMLDTLTGTQAKTDKPYNIPLCQTVKIIIQQTEGNVVCDFTGFRRRWKRACMESGVWFWFRDLRRTGATHLLLENIDLVTIQNLLGHASIETTQIYLAPSPKIQRSAIAKLEEKFMFKPKVPEFAFNEN